MDQENFHPVIPNSEHCQREKRLKKIKLPVPGELEVLDVTEFSEVVDRPPCLAKKHTGPTQKKNIDVTPYRCWRHKNDENKELDHTISQISPENKLDSLQQIKEIASSSDSDSSDVEHLGILNRQPKVKLERSRVIDFMAKMLKKSRKNSGDYETSKKNLDRNLFEIFDVQNDDILESGKRIDGNGFLFGTKNLTRKQHIGTSKFSKDNIKEKLKLLPSPESVSPVDVSQQDVSVSKIESSMSEEVEVILIDSDEDDSVGTNTSGITTMPKGRLRTAAGISVADTNGINHMNGYVASTSSAGTCENQKNESCCNENDKDKTKESSYPIIEEIVIKEEITTPHFDADIVAEDFTLVLSSDEDETEMNNKVEEGFPDASKAPLPASDYYFEFKSKELNKNEVVFDMDFTTASRAKCEEARNSNLKTNIDERGDSHEKLSKSAQKDVKNGRYDSLQMTTTNFGPHNFNLETNCNQGGDNNEELSKSTRDILTNGEHESINKSPENPESDTRNVRTKDNQDYEKKGQDICLEVNGGLAESVKNNPRQSSCEAFAKFKQLGLSTVTQRKKRPKGQSDVKKSEKKERFLSKYFGETPRKKKRKKSHAKRKKNQTSVSNNAKKMAGFEFEEEKQITKNLPLRAPKDRKCKNTRKSYEVDEDIEHEDTMTEAEKDKLMNICGSKVGKDDGSKSYADKDVSLINSVLRNNNNKDGEANSSVPGSSSPAVSALLQRPRMTQVISHNDRDHCRGDASSGHLSRGPEVHPCSTGHDTVVSKSKEPVYNNASSTVSARLSVSDGALIPRSNGVQLPESLNDLITQDPINSIPIHDPSLINVPPFMELSNSNYDQIMRTTAYNNIHYAPLHSMFMPTLPPPPPLPYPYLPHTVGLGLSLDNPPHTSYFNLPRPPTSFRQPQATFTARDSLSLSQSKLPLKKRRDNTVDFSVPSGSFTTAHIRNSLVDSRLSIPRMSSGLANSNELGWALMKKSEYDMYQQFQSAAAGDFSHQMSMASMSQVPTVASLGQAGTQALTSTIDGPTMRPQEPSRARASMSRCVILDDGTVKLDTHPDFAQGRLLTEHSYSRQLTKNDGSGRAATDTYNGASTSASITGPAPAMEPTLKDGKPFKNANAKSSPQSRIFHSVGTSNLPATASDPPRKRPSGPVDIRDRLPSKKSLSTSLVSTNDTTPQSPGENVIKPFTTPDSPSDRVRVKKRASKSAAGKLKDFAAEELLEELLRRNYIKKCVCGVYFDSYVMLMLHKSIHNTDDPFKCSQCSLRSPSWIHFQEHLNSHNK